MWYLIALSPDLCTLTYFEIVNFPFLDGDVPHSTSYGVYISQLIRFASASSHVADFNTGNILLTQKLLKQGYRYHKLRKTFFICYKYNKPIRPTIFNFNKIVNDLDIDSNTPAS